MKLLETPDITCAFSPSVYRQKQSLTGPSLLVYPLWLWPLVDCRNTFGIDRTRCTKRLGCGAVHVPVGQLGLGSGSTSATVSGRER